MTGSAKRWSGFLVASLLIAAACGGDDICINCDSRPTPTPGPSNTVTLDGQIGSRFPFYPIDEITVIACVGLAPNLVDPEEWNSCPNFKDTRSNNDGEFQIQRIEEGALRVGFWHSLSDPPSGRIERNDAFAELEDPEGQLTDVQNGELVELFDVAVDFDTQKASGGISVDDNPEPTPTPAPDNNSDS